MVAVHLITTLAQKETAKQAILKQLRDAGATSSQMPGSLEIDGDEARAGSYYLGDVEKKEAKPGIGFVVLLAILIVLSFTASLVAIAASS